MIIYVVQPGDTLYSIAEAFNIPAEILQANNDLLNPNSLVPGQTIVIVYPSQTYIVQDGDTLESISSSYGVTTMQLLRNNPSIADRGYLIPGETIVISYPTGRQIVTNGFAYPFIGSKVLKKTLPYLTYLSIFNYGPNIDGGLESYYDDTDIIQLAKSYDTVPLMMSSAFSLQGQSNSSIVYNILIQEELQHRYINNILITLRLKGYSGLNITFSYLNLFNQELYHNFLTKLSTALHSEGYLLFVSINPYSYNNRERTLSNVDYSIMYELVDNFTFFNLTWGTNYGPPSPISSNSNMRIFLDYVTNMIPADLINIGTPIIGYDWELPYIAGKSTAHALTLNSAISLAHDVGATIQFDEVSQTPYFQYDTYSFDTPVRHIVWFIDARTVDSLMKLVTDYKLTGAGLWNIMIYSAQMWLVINAQYEIIKFIPGR